MDSNKNNLTEMNSKILFKSLVKNVGNFKSLHKNSSLWYLMHYQFLIAITLSYLLYFEE